jgi:uncharacterized protein (TIRG00374 family)
MGGGVRIAAGLAAGGAMAWFVFRGTDWESVRIALMDAGRGWIAFALGCAFAGQFLRAQRLAYILRDHNTIKFREAFAATQIGMLMNAVLPLRIGEGVRVLVLVRSGGIGLSTAMAAAAVDRVTDMAALFVIVCTAVWASPTFDGIRIAPDMLQSSGAIIVPAAALTGIVAGLSAVLSIALVGLLLVRTRPAAVTRIVRVLAAAAPRALADPALSAVESFSRTAGQLASRRVMAGATAISVTAWACGIGSLFGLLSAFGLDVPWPAPFLILSLIAAFVAAPLTPGLVGQYHVPVLAGVLLVNPNVDASTAKAATIIGHLLFLVPIGVLGVAALLSTPLNARDLIGGGAEGEAVARSTTAQT